MSPGVSVTIVTYNSARFIGACLESILRESGVPLEILVVDNASTDGTLDILNRYAGRIGLIRNRRNEGFAAAQNQAIAASQAPWVLVLNPDVELLPGFIPALLEAGKLDARAGTVCGRLLSMPADLKPPRERRLDSTGIYFTPSMRHFDRGWHEPDTGQYPRMEYVFGASAAAALYRREMIEDVSIDGEFFDPDFFSYREDADVAWRAQLLGWRCIYTPAAEAYHVRRVVPSNRRAVPAVVNMHSVKNRFLMRIKNATPALYRRYWLPMLARDIVVAGACLLWEPTSLPAFWRVAACLPRALRRRRAIMSRRRLDEESLVRWFSAGSEAAAGFLVPKRDTTPA